MSKLSKGIVRSGVVVLTMLVVILASSYAPVPVLAATSPSLGAAGSYSVLAGSIVTSTGPTAMSGDLGISPSIGVPPHYTGILPIQVGGTIHDADTPAATAQAANTATFGFINQPVDVTYTGVKDLVGLSLVPGVYAADAFELSGTLTLVGSGVWIFKSASTLITSGTAKVVGGDPCDVWWRVVSSATLGTNTQLTGNILALTSISLNTGATLNGRALAQTGAVTLDSNSITSPVCSGGAPNPHLSLTKSVTPAIYNALNDTLTYTLIATNDGNITLNNVSISDPGLNITNNGGQPLNLAPGNTLTVTGTRTITQGDLDNGSLTNSATASSISGPSSSPASVTAFKQESGPHLSLTKTVLPTVFSQVGDVLYYTLVATNTGNTTLTAVSISDLDPGFVITNSGGQPVNLAPGATLTVTGAHTITQGDLSTGYFNNTAAVVSTSPAVSANATEESLRAPSVGGEDGSINKASILAPWLVSSGLVLVLGGAVITVLWLRRRTSIR
jgi:uncharacterized repeat protein (TIGR01451 family)